MKRNLELVRAILLGVQSSPAGTAFNLPEYPGIDRITVLEHARLLIQANLIEGRTLESFDGTEDAILIRLTWQGHDFIDAAQDESVWKRAMTRIGKLSGSASWAVLMEVLKAEAKELLGLP